MKLVSGLRYIDIRHIGKSKEAGTLVEESEIFYSFQVCQIMLLTVCHSTSQSSKPAHLHNPLPTALFHAAQYPQGQDED